MPTKVHLVKAMVFPVVVHGCESWTVKKAECRKIDAFELWCWRRLLRVPWTARRSNQSILKEITLDIHWKDWCWSWNSNTLGTSCEELTHWKRPWCWEGLGAGGEGNDRGWDGWMVSPTRWAWVWVNSGSWLKDREAWRAVIHGVAKNRIRLSDWTELNWTDEIDLYRWSFSSYKYVNPGDSLVNSPLANTRNAGDVDSIPGLERSPGGSSPERSSCGRGNGNPLQYSCLENPLDRGAWWTKMPWFCRVGHYWTHMYIQQF